MTLCGDARSRGGSKEHFYAALWEIARPAPSCFAGNTDVGVRLPGDEARWSSDPPVWRGEGFAGGTPVFGAAAARRHEGGIAWRDWRRRSISPSSPAPGKPPFGLDLQF